MAARQGDLGLLEERFQKIFWGMEHRDLKTVACCVVVIDGERRSFTTVSAGDHAEILFIKQVNTIIGEIQLIGPGPVQRVDITINLSKSPCFTCKEDLEDFLGCLTNEGVTVTFTLRIANLYCGVGTPGGEDKHIEYLASWLCRLNRENIVHTLVIQPISVATEIHYRPPIKAVSNLKWEIILKERRDKDTKIATITRIVTTVATIVNTVEQQQVIAQGLVNPRTTLKEKLEAQEKRTFYKSRRSDKTTCEYVAVAQVQIEAVNNIDQTKRKVFKPIEEHSTRGCCHTIPRIITEINDKKNKKPQSWCILSSTIVLAVTHFPCNKCLVNITSDVPELKRITLILRVANIHYEWKSNAARWLMDHYKAGITVELQAINVVEELGQVYCEHGASEEEKKQWTDAKEERKDYDKKAVKDVKLINTELMDTVPN